jgi:Protein of unknown function (DUF998)
MQGRQKEPSGDERASAHLEASGMNTPGHLLARLLSPAGEPRLRALAAAVIPLLALSALLVLFAAHAMPDGYSWRLHSISESAAQRQHDAWIARLSFLCFGAAVLALALCMRSRWPRLAYWANLVFAASMAGTAAFSHAPWASGEAADRTEDLLHSIFASGMGLAFCLGVAARFAHRGPRAHFDRSLDALALLAATALPLLMASVSSIGGLAQRVLFAVAYVWFGREAVIALRTAGERTHA